MPNTLIQIFRDASHTSTRGYNFLNDALENREWSFAALYSEAQRRGHYFRSLGLQAGDRMALILPDGQDFVLSFLGAISAGIIPVPMYPPLALGKLDRYIETSTRIIRTSEAKLLLTSQSVSNILWSLVQRAPSLRDIHTSEDVARNAKEESCNPLDDFTVHASDPCFLQFTSGSTSDPKGVVVTHANLLANSRAIMISGLRSDPAKDRGVSWLPLYHDMGLIGFVIAPLLNTVPVVFIPTLAFVKRPNVWMDTISKYRGTITFAPNFAFALAAKRVTSRRLEQLDLSCLRVVGCGAEPINGQTIRSFAEKFSTANLSPNAIMPAYGMAEATLAVSFDDLESPLKSILIDRDAYEVQGKVISLSSSPEPQSTSPEPQSTIELVSCGRTFPEHAVAVLGPKGQHLGDDQVGELAFWGPSVTAGYFQNEEASKYSIVEGWLHTGDLGFTRSGAIFVSGRKKDLIILNGRNYYPQSIEWEVEQLSAVRRGNVVAFSIAGDSAEQLVIAAETKIQAHDQREALEQQITQQLQEQLGIRTHKVQLLSPGTLPKTSSGKVQRARTKVLYETGNLERGYNRAIGYSARFVVAKHLIGSAFVRIIHGIRKPVRTARRWIEGFRSPLQPRG
ncbi:MAG: fatty acyl-AMP ligase [Myxococcales bacterium]|nr:fatty acyl-AMP ligase [Myxococcales bacterium]